MRARRRTADEAADDLAQLQEGLREVFDISTWPKVEMLPLSLPCQEFLGAIELLAGGCNMFYQGSDGGWRRGWPKRPAEG